jgi:NTP pyrophosphatase (non-canonical NTP hydrolase)
MYESMSEENRSKFIELVDKFALDVYNNNVDHGFWEVPASETNKSEKLMLMVTELAEACEALRHGNPNDDKVTDMPSDVVELADCVIRIMDYCNAFGLDLGAAIVAKHKFNVNRPYKHGKQF